MNSKIKIYLNNMIAVVSNWRKITYQHNAS